jgi:predicted RNase H-like HicB family nuclease
MRRYVVVFERADTNWAAYSPDVPGCIATGSTKDETARNMREALRFHIEGLILHGQPVPEGSGQDTHAEVLEVA